MSKDNMLVEFLKKESATVALIALLNAFGIQTLKRKRKFREPGISSGQIYEASEFCKRWVKQHSDSNK